MRTRGFRGAWPLLLLSFSGSACAAQHDSELRLSEQLGRARAEAAQQADRANELSLRLSRLEDRLAARDSAQATNRALMERLDQLLRHNQRLIVAQAEASARSTPAKSAGKLAATQQASDASPEKQLRTLVERWREQRHAPLSREQNQALRVLLKPERRLDSEALWPGTWY